MNLTLNLTPNLTLSLKPVFHLANLLAREQAKSECDWLVMTSVFVASKSSCFFLCSREQIRQVENRLNTNIKLKRTLSLNFKPSLKPLKTIPFSHYRNGNMYLSELHRINYWVIVYMNQVTLKYKLMNFV